MLNVLKNAAIVLLSVSGGLVIANQFDTDSDIDSSKIMTVSCVDTASQETVFYQDGVTEAKTETDIWAIKIPGERVYYVQPTGVICKLQYSVMAIENATGSVD